LNPYQLSIACGILHQEAQETVSLDEEFFINSMMQSGEKPYMQSYVLIFSLSSFSS
jgi:hypothetical protein